MSKEIIVNKGKQTRIAIVEDGELAELFIENQEHERTIGNIFLGRIRRVMPSIQAAFVDIGQKQDAFLHFSDLIENVESWIEYVQEQTPVIGKFKGDYTAKPAGKKRRRPTGQNDRGSSGRGEHHHVADEKSKDRRKSAKRRQHGHHEAKRHDDDNEGGASFDPTLILKKDMPILVKISKEPIANKGSRITTDISLAGRFLVLVPMADYVAVSKKILSFKERRRLRALARSLLPQGFGVIVRTVADGRSAKALDTDLNLLISKWKKIEENLNGKPKPPIVIHEDVNMVSSIMRDLFTEDYDRILIDDQKLYRNIKGYVQAIAPDMVADVQLDTSGHSVFEEVGIKDSVEEAFESRVNLPSGGYLFIEQTEAMHVVDVNSGRAGRGLSQEESSLRVNIEAAKIICKQVRLRDLGGIIVVDFIDMRHESNRRKLYETLKREFRADRAVTKVLPMSDFGLVQITRQRLRPSITKTFSLPDEAGQLGDGSLAAKPAAQKRNLTREEPFVRVDPADLVKKIEGWISRYRDAGHSARVRLKVHPFTASFLSGRFPSRTFRWRMRFGVKVQIDSDADVDPLTFRFFDGETGREISILPERKDREAKPTSRKDEAKNPTAEKAEVGGQKTSSPASPGRRNDEGDDSTGDSDRRRSSRGRGRGRGSSSRNQDGDASSDSKNRGRRSGGDDVDGGSDSSDSGGSTSRGRSSSRGRGRGRSSSRNEETRGDDANGGRSEEKNNDSRSDNRGGRSETSGDDSRGRGRGRGRSSSRSEDTRDDDNGGEDKAGNNRGGRSQSSGDDSRSRGRGRGRSSSRNEETRGDDNGGEDKAGNNRGGRSQSSGDDSRGRGRGRSSSSSTADDSPAKESSDARSEKPSRGDQKSDNDRGARAESKPDTKPEPVTEPTSEPKSGPKSGPKSEAKSEPTSEPKSGPRSEPTSEPKSGPRSEPTSEPKSEPKSGPKSEAKSEPKSESKTEAKPEAPVSNRFMKIDLRTDKGS